MKISLIIISALLLACAAPAAQAEPPVSRPAAGAAPKPARPAKKKKIRKRVRKAPAQPPAAAGAVIAVPAAAAGTPPDETAAGSAAPEEAPQAANAAEEAPLQADEPAGAAAMSAARPKACPHCFEPLAAGYKGILSDLEPWTAGMEAQAAALNSELSAIQKQINAKDDAIEEAKLGTDKKASKAAVKALTKDRKQLLKEYSAASGKKASFYKQYSKELEIRTKRYNKITEEKLQEALSAASQE